jgi:hypothetical protein
MKHFESKISEALAEFKSAVEQIKPGIRPVNISSTHSENVEVTKKKIDTAYKLITQHNALHDLCNGVQSHFAEMSPSLVICSSPKGFRTAWGLRSKTLSIQDAEAISNDGGQLVPVNNSSRLLSCEQQGLVLGPKKRLVLAVRHSDGNYDDSLDELGRFIYQPPKDVTGMLRYRWCQFLSAKLGVPYVILVVMWFEYRLNEKLNQMFVLAPAKIINFQDDILNLDESIHKPLHLQIIQRSEANSALNIIKSLSNETIDIDVRTELPEGLAREWSYDKLNNTSKGRQIKKWAKSNGIKCPGELCNHQSFEEISLSDIAFGHIISQNWSTAFTFISDKVHHPDNLYLTCKRCNSSLSDSFPDKTLKREVTKQGTIGDWIRLHVESIRNIK